MKTIFAVLFISLAATSAATAQSLTSVPASPFTGPNNTRPGFASAQGNFRPYDTIGNLALTGGTVQAAVARDLIANGAISEIHDEPYINDGFYGNGTSWIGTTTNSWLKIDFGQAVSFNQVRFGRDRTGAFDDRDPGQFLIQIADTDVYANGNEANDGAEYTTVFDSASLAYTGIVSGAETIQAQFALPVSARYLKMTFVNAGTAIDEVQVFNSTATTVPEPSALALFAAVGIPGVALAARRRQR